MSISFTGGYTYRFTYQDGSHIDLMLTGNIGGDLGWKDASGGVHVGSAIFPGVVSIKEIARPPRASNEL